MDAKFILVHLLQELRAYFFLADQNSSEMQVQQFEHFGMSALLSAIPLRECNMPVITVQLRLNVRGCSHVLPFK